MLRQSIEHLGPALVWTAVFVTCVAADAALGCWATLPVFVAGFYAGVVAIELTAYPLLGRWRTGLATRGPRVWYLAVVGVPWAVPAATVALLSPLWLGWG